MPFKLEVKGGIEAEDAINAVLEAHSPRGYVANFRTLMSFLHTEVKRKTPGKGQLRGAWRKEVQTEDTADGWSLKGRIHNTKANTRVYHTNVLGKRKPSLKADDSPLYWRDVLNILDAGSKPHVIRPLRGKFLAFFINQSRRSPTTGRFRQTQTTVFTKGVHHPGTKAYGMISDTYQQLLTIIEAAGGEMGDRHVDAWVKARVPVGVEFGRSGIINPNL